MFCVLLSQITSCCANLFQDFPFSLVSLCILSFISKLNEGSILKVKVASPKSDVIWVAINKRINTNSNEASWASHWEAAHVLLHMCDHMIFMKWVISLNNMTVMR